MERIRVGLADDVPRMRAVLSELLELDGRFDVVAEASDGFEAVCVAARERPDVMIVDFNMPVMDGLEAIPQIREASPHTAVVMMSSLDARELAHRARSAGAAGYVEKGASLSELVRALIDANGLYPALAAAAPAAASRGA